MISIIRLKSQERKDKICDLVMARLNDLQKSLKERGLLLYLTKRARHEDVSLFIHTIDPDFLGDFIAERLSRIEHVTGIWVLHMIKPVFYPLPKDKRKMKRYAVSLKVFPKSLKDVYGAIAAARLPNGLKLAYLAFTFHLFEDSLQLSLLTEKDEILNDHISGTVGKMSGVLGTTVNLIERTRPLVSYEAWRDYSAKHGIIPSWDDDLMIGQFQS